jgi:hypothetical protein
MEILTETAGIVTLPYAAASDIGGRRGQPGRVLNGWPGISGRTAARRGGRRYVEPWEQVSEELLEQSAGLVAVSQFGGAEAEYLIPPELEVPVAGHVGCISGAVWSSVRAIRMLRSVHFEDDSLTNRKQEQEVHPDSQQSFASALASRLRIPCSQTSGSAGRSCTAPPWIWW